MKLSVILPVRDVADPIYRDFLKSLHAQTMPKDQYEVLAITEGNSEEAKAIGIQRAKGDILAFFCADNYLRDPEFLASMCWELENSIPSVAGCYTSHYDHVLTDKPLSRYFALLGANDPLCWFLGKADRRDYTTRSGYPTYVTYHDPANLPSLGDNGFFCWAKDMKAVVTDPSRHFPMDAVSDMIQHTGNNSFKVVGYLKVWHRTGESFLDYLRRRYVYTRDLYFRQRGKRRWHMVGRRDWPKVALFTIMSLCGVPHLRTVWKGYKSLPDSSWAYHPIVCFSLTCVYLWCFIRWGLWSRSSCPPSGGGIRSRRLYRHLTDSPTYGGNSYSSPTLGRLHD